MSRLLALLFCCACVSLVTVEAQLSANDIGILNYALTLEHLESAFYRDGLAKYTAANFTAYGSSYAALQEIAAHEAAHVVALNQTILAAGGIPVQECTYDFGYTTVAGFLAVARALENTGVSAYDGAVSGFDNADVQTVAATIATIEARHAAFLNVVANVNGNPFPSALDLPLNPRQIVTIAGGFIVSCPAGSLPNIQAFPKFSVTPASGPAGTRITVTPVGGANLATATQCAFVTGTSTSYAALTANQCSTPGGAIAGDLVVFLTNDTTTPISLTSYDSVQAGPSYFLVTSNVTYLKLNNGASNNMAVMNRVQHNLLSTHNFDLEQTSAAVAGVHFSLFTAIVALCAAAFQL